MVSGKRGIVEGGNTVKGIGPPDGSGEACKVRGILGRIGGEYLNKIRNHSSYRNLLPEEELVMTVETWRSGYDEDRPAV